MWFNIKTLMKHIFVLLKLKFESNKKFNRNTIFEMK